MNKYYNSYNSVMYYLQHSAGESRQQTVVQIHNTVISY